MSETTSVDAPAGWYPAGSHGRERYWDGVQWTGMVRDVAGAGRPGDSSMSGIEIPAEPGSDVAPSIKRPWYKRPLIAVPLGVVAAVILVSGIANAIGGGGEAEGSEARPAEAREQSADEPVAQKPAPVLVTMPDVVGMPGATATAVIEAAGLSVQTTGGEGDLAQPVVSTDPAASTRVEPGSTVTLTLQDKPQLTLGQRNATAKAQDYLSFMGFSRQGLIEQLQYEGYSVEDATFGADNAGADWNSEAAEKARDYLDSMAFSRDGLYDQLEYEGFPPEQIAFALAAVGY